MPKAQKQKVAQPAQYKFDEKDRLIIEALRANARLSTQAISKKTLIPITTVHNRMKKLEKAGVIRSYTITLDNKKLGKTIAAYILIKVDYILLRQKNISQHDLARKLKQLSSVEEVDLITGVHDIIAKVRVESMEQLDQLVTKNMRRLDGVASTETMVLLSEI